MTGTYGTNVLALQLADLDPGKFEELVYLLVDRDVGAAIRVGHNDAGVDVLVPANRRAFQCKRFTRSVSWAQCEASLRRAQEQYEFDVYTFVFSRDLSGDETRAFAARFADWPGCTVNLWSLPDLRLMLELNPAVAATMLGSAGPPIRDLDPRPAPSPHFTGRESLLEALSSSLEQQRRVILHGLAGVGKSQVAVAHDETRVADYARRWWLDASSTYALRGGLQAIAEDLGLATALGATSIDEIHRELRRRDEPWLIVVEDALTADAVAPLPAGEDGHVIVTSTNPSWRATPAAALEVPPLSSDAARRFLATRSGRDDPALTDLALDLEGLPLVIEQAAAFLEQTPELPVDAYRELFARRAAELLADDVPLGPARSVAATWRLSIDQAKAIAPDAEALLGILAHLAHHHVPVALLNADPEGTFADPLARAAALGALRRLSLVRSREGGASVSMHRLVQLVTRHLGGAAMPAFARRAGTMVWDAVPEVQARLEVWPAMTALLPHALSCADHLGGQPEGADLAARLLTASGNFLKSRGDRRLARELIGQAVDLSSADEDAPIAAQQAYVKRLGNFGAINADLGDLDVAADVQRRSMVRRERLYGPDAPETIIAVNNLAGVLRDAGRNEAALPLMERAWRIRRDLPFEDERRGWGAHGLAFVLLALDRSGEALPYADEAIEVFSGPGRPPEGAAWAHELRAEIRLALRDVEGARTDATSALLIRRRAAEHHVDVGKALLVSARVALAEGDDGRARRELTEALAVMEPELGAEHLDVVTAREWLTSLEE